MLTTRSPLMILRRRMAVCTVLVMSSLLATGLAASAATPNAPGAVTVSYSASNALVSWTAPTPVTVTVTGYTVTSSPGGLTCTVASPGLTCIVPGLTSSTSYIFSVFASSAGGPGPSTSSSPSTSPAQTPSSVSLSASPPSPQNQNAPITFIAVVTPGATGTVTFTNSGATITGCNQLVVSSGIAICTTIALPAATAMIVASYSGDANYASSSSSTLSYVISATTLAPASSPLIITTTVAPINTTVTLATSGGNGAGAVSYVVVNGTASGCAVSGAVLSVPANVSGTCLVTAHQAGAGTYLPVTSNVTTVNFYWFYATYPYSYYYCNGGDSLSGSTCTHTYGATGIANDGWYCSAGWSPATGSSVCTRDAYISQASCTANGGSWAGSYCVLETSGNYGTDGGAFGYIYECNSGGSLSGTTCTITYAASTAGGYSCPNGGTLSGLRCSISGGSGPNLRHQLLTPFISRAASTAAPPDAPSVSSRTPESPPSSALASISVPTGELS